MAKRPSIRARATARSTTASAQPTHSAKAAHPSAQTRPAHPANLPTNKKTRRIQKHNDLMTRVRDAGVSKQASMKKRRRPAKKMPAAEGLGDLSAALPELSDDDGSGADGGGSEGSWEGFDDDEQMDDNRSTAKRRRRRVAAGQDGKIQMRSLKSRPGAMKKKRAMEGREVDRFSRNLALLTSNGDAGQGGEACGKGGGVQAREGTAGQSGKWAALRRFIEGTMVKDTAFRGG
ncbi:uncharacterized protein LTR77_001938 [Saxophila tyrrhenica]|uniref:Ribosome biogenesis protein SLX9 n=1 Tax=Saxophila tyrrhenica TaxID=1690608 RepID=A0AAV9PH53_9PEZI|nr:hypothetical protein LTR77_001938 [Saxophila tyrrhenica]